MFIFGKDYLNNKPIKVDNVFEHSKVQIYKVPKFNINADYNLLAPNYNTYPDNCCKNHICMTTHNQTTKKCQLHKILQIPRR